MGEFLSDVEDGVGEAPAQSLGILLINMAQPAKLLIVVNGLVQLIDWCSLRKTSTTVIHMHTHTHTTYREWQS